MSSSSSEPLLAQSQLLMSQLQGGETMSGSGVGSASSNSSSMFTSGASANGSAFRDGSSADHMMMSASTMESLSPNYGDDRRESVVDRDRFMSCAEDMQPGTTDGVSALAALSTGASSSALPRSATAATGSESHALDSELSWSDEEGNPADVCEFNFQGHRCSETATYHCITCRAKLCELCSQSLHMRMPNHVVNPWVAGKVPAVVKSISSKPNQLTDELMPSAEDVLRSHGINAETTGEESVISAAAAAASAAALQKSRNGKVKRKMSKKRKIEHVEYDDLVSSAISRSPKQNHKPSGSAKDIWRACMAGICCTVPQKRASTESMTTGDGSDE